MKKFTRLMSVASGLLLLSFISALLMMTAFLENRKTHIEYVLDAARIKVIWENGEGRAIADYARAVSDDVRIIAHARGQKYVIPDFGFDSPDAIFAELSRLPAGENYVDRDDRGVQYMFAAAQVEKDNEVCEAFVATKLYTCAFSSGACLALLIVNFLTLASCMAVLCFMYGTVRSHISRISRNLRDLSGNEAEEWLKEYVSEKRYLFGELKFLAERLRDFLESHKTLKLAVDKSNSDGKKVLESVTRYLEKGERIAAEYTRLGDEYDNVDFYLRDCKLNDFSVIGDAIQSRMAGLLKEAVGYAVRRGAEEIYVSLQDGDDDVIFEIRDNGRGFNMDGVPGSVKKQIDESRAEGLFIEIAPMDRTLRCLIKN